MGIEKNNENAGETKTFFKNNDVNISGAKYASIVGG
jgi:hypothetical protein